MNTCGIFVVEFIGNGKSSRCIIQKGNLRFLDNPTADAHKLKIYDEYWNLVEKPKILIDGEYYHSNEDNIVTIPYAKNQESTSQILLIADTFCISQSLNRKTDQYNIDVGFHIDREQLVAGNTAQIIIRCQLLCNDVHVSNKLIKDCDITIKSSLLDNDMDTSVIRNVQLSDEKYNVLNY